MDPVCFHLGARPVYWYGVMVAAGFLAATVHWTRLARKDGRRGDLGSDLALWLMVGGVIGARLAYVAANWNAYAGDLPGIVRVDQGGLVWYGGFLGGAAGAAWLARRRGIGLAAFADYAATGVPLGHALGRVGCFLNSCCYGKPTSLAIGVAAADATRHPVPLYEAAFNLLLYLVLVRRYLRPRGGGEVFGLYLGAYGAWRFAAEFLRGDERLAWFGLTGAQWLSLGVAAAGLAVLFGRRRAAAGAGDPGHGTAHGTGR